MGVPAKTAGLPLNSTVQRRDLCHAVIGRRIRCNRKEAESTMNHERIQRTAKLRATYKDASAAPGAAYLPRPRLVVLSYLSCWPLPVMRRPFAPSMRKRSSPVRFLRNRAWRPRTDQSAPSTSTFRKSNSLISANAWRRHAGLTRKRSMTNPRASGWRRCRRWCTTGATATTGAT